MSTSGAHFSALSLVTSEGPDDYGSVGAGGKERGSSLLIQAPPNTSSPSNTSSMFAYDEEEPELSQSFEAADNSRLATFATGASWAVNIFLMIAKSVVLYISGSKAVLAAVTDSAVDLASQAVLSWAEWYINRHNPDYPVGRSRLEALSVLGCSAIMIMASIEVIQFSAVDLNSGLNGEIPELLIDKYFYGLIGAGIAVKFALWILCYVSHMRLRSDMMEALAEDHFNDVLSNTAAMTTAAVAYNVKNAWWVDPFGAIVISIVIIFRWLSIIKEQVKKIVGHTAPPEFISRVNGIAQRHDPRLAVDVTRAYHFGARYNVEMEIVLPGSMTVMESHDIALALQHKIEGLADVERAFVHVDHQERDGLEHKVERELVQGLRSNSEGGEEMAGSSSPPKASELRNRNVGGNRKERDMPL